MHVCDIYVVGKWITKFEDGTEDRVTNTAADEDYTFL